MRKGWPESECCDEGRKPAINGGPVPGVKVARARLSERPKHSVVAEGIGPGSEGGDHSWELELGGNSRSHSLAY